MTDYEKIYEIITRFPARDEDGEDNYKLGRKKRAIYFATSDSYCWAGLYFDKEGNFVGFHLPL